MLGEESAKELEARQALGARLNPGEKLLEYTRANRITSSTSPHYVGLTDERLVLLPIKGKLAGHTLSVGRAAIKSVQWRTLPSERIQVKLLRDQLDLLVDSWFGAGRWKKRAKELASMAQAPVFAATREPAIARQRQLEQIRDLQTLGFLSSAEAQFDDLMRTDAALAADPSVADFKTKVSEARGDLKVAAGFLFGDVIMFTLVTGLVFLLMGSKEALGLLDRGVVVALIADVVIGVSLWKGRTQWRGWAILRAILGFLLEGFGALARGEVIALISQAAYSSSLLLVLTGKTSRRRTWIAILIYLVGYPGIVLFQIAFAFVSGLLRAL